MNRLAEELDEKLRSLDPERARELESRVREVLAQADNGTTREGHSAWPVGYFEETAGQLADEAFPRPPQGELPDRERW